MKFFEVGVMVVDNFWLDFNGIFQPFSRCSVSKLCGPPFWSLFDIKGGGRPRRDGLHEASQMACT